MTISSDGAKIPPGARTRILTLTDGELLKECVLDFHKASGNGGQKVNKTSSAVRITHTASGLSAQDASERSQTRNRGNALAKLRRNAALCRREEITESTPLPDFENIPSVDNVMRYAPFAALLLDHLEDLEGELIPASLRFGTTRSKVLRVLSRDGALLESLNAIRKKFSKPPLKALK